MVTDVSEAAATGTTATAGAAAGAGPPETPGAEDDEAAAGGGTTAAAGVWDGGAGLGGLGAIASHTRRTAIDSAAARSSRFSIGLLHRIEAAAMERVAASETF